MSKKTKQSVSELQRKARTLDRIVRAYKLAQDRWAGEEMLEMRHSAALVPSGHPLEVLSRAFWKLTR